MYELLLLNFKNIFYAMILFGISYVSNICLSLFYNIKVNQEPFDYKKLLTGVLKLISICAGIFLLTAVITCLPIYLQSLGIPLSEEFSNTISVVAIATMFIGSIYKYAKEAFDTLKNILNYSSDSDI